MTTMTQSSRHLGVSSCLLVERFLPVFVFAVLRFAGALLAVVLLAGVLVVVVFLDPALRELDFFDGFVAGPAPR